jgi:hypothetical protein
MVFFPVLHEHWGGNHRNEVTRENTFPRFGGAGEEEGGRISEWPVTLRVHVQAATATANDTIPGPPRGGKYDTTSSRKSTFGLAAELALLGLANEGASVVRDWFSCRFLFVMAVPAVK